MITAMSIGIGLLVAGLLFRTFFDDFGEFVQTLRYWLTPDIFLAFQGEWTEGHWAQLKLGLYALLSVGSGVLAYDKLLGWLH
jgi:hypothetical protein